MGNFLGTFVSDFLGRLDGPLHFRFFLQPLMAILLAVRDGRKDAREGRPAYGWAVCTDPTHRRQLLVDGWKGISRVFVLAYGLDVIYQIVVWHGLRAAQALTVALVLAVIPYALLRGPVNRLLRLGRKSSTA